MSLFRWFRCKVWHGLTTITAKVLLAMLVIILPVNIFAVVLSDLAIESTRQQAIQVVTSTLDNYLSDIEKRLTNRSSILLSLKDSGVDSVILSKQLGDSDYIKAKARFFTTLNSLIHMDKSTSGCFYYFRKLDDMLLLSVDTSLHYQADMTAYVSEMVETGAQSGWLLRHIPGSKANSAPYPVLFLLTMIGDVYYGTWIELEEVARNLVNEIPYKNTLVAFSNIVSDKPSSGSAIISAKLERAGLYLSVTIPQNSLSGNLQTFHALLILSAALGFLLIPFLFTWLNMLVLKPLRWIHKGHLEMENGNQNYRITKSTSSVEFRESIGSFNHMADSIHRLTIENYEKELERQRFEMRSLELQIRPHFLLNTFNLIFTLAERNENDEIKDIVLYLSEYFRYIVRKPNSLEPYEKEHSLIEGYLNMANVRYPGTLAVEYDYAPGILAVPVPPLLIHSFVENIVKHVAQQGTHVKVLIRGKITGSNAEFEIMDDGPGLDETTLHRVVEQMQQGNLDGAHIGLANACRRVKHFYADQAEIEFISEVGIGTCVTLRIPCGTTP